MPAKQTITETEYLDELVRAYTQGPPPNAFTIDDVVQRGMPERKARTMLSQDPRIASGKYKRDGKWLLFYWLKTPSDKP